MFQLRWLWKNLEGNRGRYILAVALQVICSAAVLVNPMITGLIVDKILIGQNTGGEIIRQMDKLVPYALAMIGFTLGRTGLAYFMVMQFEYCSQALVVKVRNHLYHNMQIQDMDFYDKNRTGDLMTRLTGDMDMVRHTAAWVVRMFIDSATLFLATIIFFFTINPLFTLTLLAIVPVIFFVSRSFSKLVRPKYIALREKLSQLNSRAQENISGNKVVRAFAREDHEIKMFDDKSREYRDASIEASLTWLRFYPLVESLAQILTVVVMLAGGLFIMAGKLTFGEFVIFSMLSWALSNPMKNLGILLNDLQRFFASASKIIELYYARPSIVSRHDAVKVSGRIKGAVEFDGVTLKFGCKEVLKDISFSVSPGETVAIMGNTGSGKTMLVSLLPRLYDISGGSLTIDGVSVNLWDLKHLRKNIGIATQEVFLFSDTVDGNIAYGDSKLPEEDVRCFAEIAAVDFVDRLENGYDTLVGERGTGLSGGQKQRIALARALAVKPSILILDDTTSAVDMETEKFIQENLRNLDFVCTKFIIAQRTSTTKSADKIIIMEDGRILEMGSHDELLRRGGYYAEIYKLQNHGAKGTEVET